MGFKYFHSMSHDPNELAYAEVGTEAFFIVKLVNGMSRKEALQGAFAHLKSCASAAGAVFSTKSGTMYVDVDGNKDICEKRTFIHAVVTVQGTGARNESLPGVEVTQDTNIGSPVIYSPPNHPGQWYEARFSGWKGRALVHLDVGNRTITVSAKRVRVQSGDFHASLKV